MRAYKVVDVFTAKPLLGNPVAVVLDAEGLSDGQMQALARWTNLSETTFLLPPTQDGADYRLRIFTPGGELPFAGHPTLGSAHAALEAGRAVAKAGVLIQECGVGLVRVSVAGDGAGRLLKFDVPPARQTLLSPEDRAELEAIVGAPLLPRSPPAMVNLGPTWIVAEVESGKSLLALDIDLPRLAAMEKRLGVTGLTLFGSHAGDDIETRSFAPASGIPEDPVCGSGNGAVAAFRIANGLVSTGYRSTQGGRLGRDGQVIVEIGPSSEEFGGVTVGGACVTCVEGSLVY